MVKSLIKLPQSSHISKNAQKKLKKNKNKSNKRKKLFERKLVSNFTKEARKKESKSNKAEDDKNKETFNLDQIKERSKNYYLKERIICLEDDCKSSLGEFRLEKLELLKDKISENKSQYFSERDRSSAILSLHQMISQIVDYAETIKKFHDAIPNNLFFETITLFDYALSKNNQILSSKELTILIISSLYLISKHRNIPIFNSLDFYSHFLKETDLINSQAKMLKDVEGVLFPIKHLDYFERILFYFKQFKPNDKNFIEFLVNFQKQYYELSFIIVFDYEVSLKYQSVIFIIVMYDVNENMKKKLNEQLKCYCRDIEDFMEYFKRKSDFNDNEYYETEVVIRRAFIEYKKKLNDSSI